MALSNYLLPLLGGAALMTMCYLMGRFGYSSLWIAFFVLLNYGKSHMWRQREKRLLALRQAAVQEREVIIAQLQDLPAWVQFPDTERVEWINKVILQLWPYIGEYSKKFLREQIEPQVKAQMPGPFKSFKFLQMDMGDIPCRVGGIKVYTHNVGRDRIIVDMDVAYAGDSEFTVGVAGFRGGLNQLQFTGKLRAILKPLLPYPPMIGGVSAFFLESPKIDFNLTGMGEMVELPGLLNAIRSIVNTQVANICVLPNEIVIPLAPNVDVTKLYFPEPDGVIRIQIVEAKNLENRDISLAFLKKGKSDPYCEIQVGSQFFKTRTIDDDLNPTFNEYFEAVVDQADGQKLRIELFDEDTAGSDEELGRLSLDLDRIQRKGVIDKWFPLEGCKHGDLHVKVHWLNLSRNPKDMERQEWDTAWLKADKPIHPALLMVFVDNVSNLPYPKAKLEPSPYIEVALGKNIQKTPVKVKTVNPLYQCKFIYFVKNPESEELKFVAKDEGTKRILGELTIPLKNLLTEPNMDYFQSTFSLTYGVHQSPIVLTIRLRSFTPGVDTSEFRADRSEDLLAPIIASTARLAQSIAPAGQSAQSNGATSLKVDGQLTTLTDDVSFDRTSSVVSLQSRQSGVKNDRKFVDRFRSSKHRFNPARVPPLTRGRLCIGLRYSHQTNRLVVIVHKVSTLQAVDVSGSAEPYVTVKLLSVDNAVHIKRKTPIARGTLHPIFDAQFEYEVHHADLHNYLLQFAVKDATNYGLFAKTPLLGRVEFRLANFDKSQQLVNHWVDLDPPKS